MVGGGVGVGVVVIEEAERKTGWPCVHDFLLAF